MFSTWDENGQKKKSLHTWKMSSLEDNYGHSHFRCSLTSLSITLHFKQTTLGFTRNVLCSRLVGSSTLRYVLLLVPSADGDIALNSSPVSNLLPLLHIVLQFALFDALFHFWDWGDNLIRRKPAHFVLGSITSVQLYLCLEGTPVCHFTWIVLVAVWLTDHYSNTANYCLFFTNYFRYWDLATDRHEIVAHWSHDSTGGMWYNYTRRDRTGWRL